MNRQGRKGRQARQAAALLAVFLVACGGGGKVGPDAATVDLMCDDPALVADLRAAAQGLPDAALVPPAAEHRAALLASIDAAAAAIAAGPPAAAAQLLAGDVSLHIDADVADADARASLHALADGAAAALTRPTLACPSVVLVSCVPPAGKTVAFDVAAADCTDPAPAVTCTPASGSIVLPGDSAGSCTATTSMGATATCAFEVHASAEGAPAIACPANVSVACAAPLTPVELPAPVVDESCAQASSVTNDAPAAGYPVGETTVTFTATAATGADSCTTAVVVTDADAPQLTCPPATTIVRTDPAAGATPPAAIATDGCDDALEVVASPTELTRGTTTVAWTATDDADLTTSCDAAITVVDAFPPTALRVARATLDTGGATAVTLAWDRTFAADATGYRVERAADAAGPWTALGSVPVGTQTFVDAALPPPAAWYRVVTVAAGLDGGAAGPLQAHAIAAAGYDLDGQSVPGVGFATTLYGVVRHPVDLAAGPYPLVVLIHGNHGICRSSPTSVNDSCATSSSGDCPWPGYVTTPNAEGLAYLAETLAAHGMVAVTISANALNCRNDYILERAQLVLEHLRRWRGWATAGGAPFGTTFVGAVDTSRVGLVGHSRGGEAVAHVPTELAATPIAGVAVTAVFSIAPTDYHSPTPGGVPYAVLLPACDGDVTTLDGMHIYDRALDPADPSPRSQVLFAGANHNFFSTEWRTDDNGDGWVCDVSLEVGAPAQQAMLSATLGAWFDATLAGAAWERFLRAEGPTPLGIHAAASLDLDLRWAYAAPERVPIDDFEGAGSPAVNLLGQDNGFAEFTTATRCVQLGCDDAFEHEKAAIKLSWQGGTPVASFGLGGLDATGRAVISFRVASRVSSLNPPWTNEEWRLRVADAEGRVAELILSDVQRVPDPYESNYTREILQTVRVPLDDLLAVNPALDLAALDTFELVMGAPGRDTGSILVTDVELAE